MPSASENALLQKNLAAVRNDEQDYVRHLGVAAPENVMLRKELQARVEDGCASTARHIQMPVCVAATSREETASGTRIVVLVLGPVTSNVRTIKLQSCGLHVSDMMQIVYLVCLQKEKTQKFSSQAGRL